MSTELLERYTKFLETCPELLERGTELMERCPNLLDMSTKPPPMSPDYSLKPLLW